MNNQNIVVDDDDDGRHVVNNWTAKFPHGTKIRKFFEGHGWYIGQVDSYRIDGDDDTTVYHVVYTDGDMEELLDEDVEALKHDGSGSESSSATGDRIEDDGTDDDEFQLETSPTSKRTKTKKKGAESKQSSSPVKAVTPSPKKKARKSVDGALARPKKKTLSARSIAMFGLPKGAVARHKQSGLTVRSLDGIQPLLPSVSSRGSWRLTGTSNGTRKQATPTPPKVTDPLPGRLVLLDLGDVSDDKDDDALSHLVGTEFESGSSLKDALPAVDVLYDTMEAIADPKFTSFALAKARLQAAGLLPDEQDSNSKDEERLDVYLVLITWDGKEHSTLSVQVEWYNSDKCEDYDTDNLTWGVLEGGITEAKQGEGGLKKSPPLLIGLSTSLLGNQTGMDAVDAANDSNHSRTSGSDLLPLPSKKLAGVQLPASLTEKALRRACPVPLIESAVELLHGKPYPGRTLAFLNAVWKGMIVDARPFTGDDRCLGFPQIISLALIAAVDSTWQPPATISKAVVVSAVRATAALSCPWPGYVENNDKWYILESTAGRLSSEDRDAVGVRNVLRVAQASIGGRLAWGKWNRFEGDPSAAAILSYTNHRKFNGSRLQEPSALENEDELIVAFEKLTKIPPVDSRWLLLNKECRRSAVDLNVLPQTLIVLQALLPHPPRAWKKHSLPSLARLVRRLISDANPRVHQKQMQLARAAQWGEVGNDTQTNRPDGDSMTKENRYTSFRQVVSLTSTLSAQESELIDSFEAIQDHYLELLRSKKIEDIQANHSSSPDQSDVVPNAFLAPTQEINEAVGRWAFLLLFGAAIEVTACGEVVSAMFCGGPDEPLLIQRIGKARREGQELATAGGSTSGATAVPSLGYVQPTRSDEEAALYLAAQKEVAKYWRGGLRLELSPCCEGYQWNLPEILKWSGWGDSLVVHRTAKLSEEGIWKFYVGEKEILPFDARAVISGCSFGRDSGTKNLQSLRSRPELYGIVKTLLYVPGENQNTSWSSLAFGQIILDSLDRSHSIAMSDRSNEGVVYDWLDFVGQSMIPPRTWLLALLAIRMREKNHVVLGHGIRSDGNGTPRDMSEGVLLRIFAALEALYPTALRKESAFRFRVRCTGASFHHMMDSLQTLGRGCSNKGAENDQPKINEPSVADNTTPSPLKRKREITPRGVEGLPVITTKRPRRQAFIAANETLKMTTSHTWSLTSEEKIDTEVANETSWDQAAISSDSSGENYMPLPRIKTKLWPHQARSVETILSGVKQGKRGHADASSVGSGKTLTALAAIVEIQQMMGGTGQQRHGTLVLLPTPSLIKEWLLETALHTESFHVIEQREDGSLFSLTYGKSHPPIDGCSLVISTLDRVASHPFIHKTSWDFVVVDECLSVQNASAKRTPSAWRQIEISLYGCLLLSATFFRSKFDQLFYMIRMLRSPLPRSMEWLPATIHEHIVCCIPESERKWILKPVPVALPKKELAAYREIIDAFGRKQLNSKGADGRELWSSLETFLRSSYEGRKKKVYESQSVMSGAIIKLCKQLLKKKRRPLVFANTQKEADFFLTSMAKAGIEAASWQSVASDRLSVKLHRSSPSVIVAVKTTQGQGLNMQHHADAIICRPTAGDLLEQMKGRIDRPGQKTKELQLFCIFAEHTIEEAQYANIHLVGNFFREYIAPVAEKYRVLIDVEAVMSARGKAALKSGTVRKQWHKLLDTAGMSGTFQITKQDEDAMSIHCDDDDGDNRKPSKPCTSEKMKTNEKAGSESEKYAPLNKVKRNRADPIVVRQQKELARSGKASKVVRTWLFGEPRRTVQSKADKGLSLESFERYSDITPPVGLTESSISDALVHLSKHDKKLGALIARVGKGAIERSVGSKSKPTQANFFDKVVRAITFTMVSVDAGHSFLRRLAMKVFVCVENLPTARKKKILQKALKEMKESGIYVKDSKSLMERFAEGRHKELLFSHSLVGELVDTCDVVDGKQLGYPHICGTTYPCGKHDDHSEFLAKAREGTVSCGYSRDKAVFIVSLVQDFRAGRLSAKDLENASDREAAKILKGIKGIGDWTAGQILLNFLGRADIMLYGDLTVRNYINDLYDINHKEGETLLQSAADFPDTRENRNLIDALAKKNNWTPYRTVVCYLMWFVQEEGNFLLL